MVTDRSAVLARQFELLTCVHSELVGREGGGRTAGSTV